MSFNARLSDAYPNRRRRRPAKIHSNPSSVVPANGPVASSSRAIPEDVQPNESIDKRRVQQPPLIRTSNPSSRGRGYYNGSGRPKPLFNHRRRGPGKRHGSFGENVRDSFGAPQAGLNCAGPSIRTSGGDLMSGNAFEHRHHDEIVTISTSPKGDQTHPNVAHSTLDTSLNGDEVHEDESGIWTSLSRQKRPRESSPSSPSSISISLPLQKRRFSSPLPIEALEETITLSSVVGDKSRPTSPSLPSVSALPSVPRSADTQPGHRHSSSSIPFNHASDAVSEPSVKAERSPSPFLNFIGPPAPRPLTSGSLLYAPLPLNCRANSPNYRAHRREWIVCEQKRVKSLNADIKVVRAFTRDDGMVIDWKSRVPIMSDIIQSLPHTQDARVSSTTSIQPDSRHSDGTQAINVDANEATVHSPSSARHEHYLTASASTPGNVADVPSHEGPPVATSPVHAEPVALPRLKPTKLPTRVNGGQPNGPIVSSTPAISSSSNLRLAAFSAHGKLGSSISSSTAGVHRLSSTVESQQSTEDFRNSTSLALTLPRSKPLVSPHGINGGTAGGSLQPFSMTTPTVHDKNGPRPSRQSDVNAVRSSAEHLQNIQGVQSEDSPARSVASSSGQYTTRKPASSATSERSDTSAISPSAPLPLPRRIHSNSTSDKHLEHARDQAPPPETQAVSSKLNTPTVDDSQDIADEVQELEEAALEFLQKHIRAFDSDRSSLASAYSRLATFSVQTHHPPDAPSATPLPRSLIKLPHPRGPTRSMKQGRLAIIAELLSLPDDHQFCTGRPTSINYDVTCLESTVGVLLVCYSESEDGWACDQRFVLRRKEWDKEDGSTEGLWPLIAVCHQMTFREKTSR